jgi:oxalyl-CoA decarboxylase
MRAELAREPVPMDYFSSLRAVRDVLEDHRGAFIVSEGANTLDNGRNILNMYEPRKRLDTGTWGVMGVGLGYAIAAAVESGSPVVAVEGDSAFGFSGMEIETMCRYGLPIVVIVFNNNGVYRGDEVNHYSADPAPTVFTSGSRYDKLIEAFGGGGYHAETTERLASALRQALETRRPALINCVIDPKAGTESGHLEHLNV